MDAQALGRYLRQSREAKELTLEEAERALRIRRRVLEAFELGEFALPECSPVQIRGFLRNYAVYLSLDDERVLQHYQLAISNIGRKGRRASSLVGGVPSSRKNSRRSQRESQSSPSSLSAAIPSQPRSATDTPPNLPAVPRHLIEQANASPVLMPGSTLAEPPAPAGIGVVGWLMRLLVAGAAVAVIGFVVIQFLQPTQPADDTPGILEILAPSSAPDEPTGVPSLTAIPTVLQISQPTAVANAFNGQGVQVSIEMEQRAWVRVLVDEREDFVGIARIGERMDYTATNAVVVSSSNAEALRVTYNGQPQAVFGARGQQVEVTFTPMGVQVAGEEAAGEGTAPTTETTLDPAAIALPAELPTDTLVDTAGGQAAPPTAAPALAASPAEGSLSLTLPGIESLSSMLTAGPDANAAQSTVPPTVILPNATEPESFPTDIIPTDSSGLPPLVTQVAPESSSSGVIEASPSPAPAQATQALTLLPTLPPTQAATTPPQATDTPRATVTPTATRTPSPQPPTATPSRTNTPAPTAVLPPRENAPNATLPPTKAAG